jgi:mannose-6-phosphate isomerase-like protein (cupin superfamily)
MHDTFPEPIRGLPRAAMPLPGATAYLSQGSDHQVVFASFSEDADLPEHSHAAQWGVVLEGKIEFTFQGMTRTYRKGDHYFIPAGVKHSGRLFAGYADVTFYAQRDRFEVL